MAPMTATKPPETALSTTEFAGTGTIHNPANGAIAGEFCRVETVVGPRTNVGAGQNYYHNSLKALKRVNKVMTKMALSRPRRVAK
jgi:hypothetical protein